MQLDLSKSSKALRKHIAQRVRDYPKYINEGPGDDAAPIKQITLGFQFDQAGWAALIFDTRPHAAIDGKWNSFIEPNAIDFPEWHRAFMELSENGSSVKVALADGTKKAIGNDAAEERLAELIGVSIRNVLVSARDDGELVGLPLAADCVFVVEEHDGYYAWSDQAARAVNSEETYLAQLDGEASSKTKDEQVQHWLQVLDRVASGKESESEWSFLAPDHAIERLETLGDMAIIPLLKFVRKWAGKPEFDADRPKRKINELPMQTPVIAALMLVCGSDQSTSEAESLLRAIVRRSVAVNSGRKLWGSIPVWAARCLSQLFPDYPEPKQDERTNELLNRDDYTKGRDRKQ